ncbi:hypothetical protein OE88DRAFT_1801793 [Heliocybe sulcata]|uniref:P-loop containing nucleoside triphosphate hydrolase protein n=1 Tax=Heliocybe sulcata TaxID=5364 RepID=A0A5C3N2U2_9AGAM|nr:hypothetical protein OE88DRAFT_1801793 [Heliocybe sulcata]
MSELASHGKYNEVIGREDEIRRNSAVLIGEPGVGKTAVVEGLAQRIATSQVPDSLKGIMYNLDLGALFAGAGKGEYEERVKGVIDDVARSQQTEHPAILFIDEIHLITAGKSSGGSNSGMDAANLLKPALARGEFRCVGATTLAEYREHIEKDGALERRFAPVIVNEPTTEEATHILRGSRERYERHHRVWIKDESIPTAVTLAHKYLTARRLPDSAIDLMDEACASARVAQTMQPEAVDTLKQQMSYLTTYITGLERDSDPQDDGALQQAKRSLADKQGTLKRLEEHQESILKWWKDIAGLQDAISSTKRKVELTKSRSEKSQLENELKRLRNEFSKRRSKEPDYKGSTVDIRLSRSLPHIITSESIAAIVERSTKIPVQRLLASEKAKLMGLEIALSDQVKGQPEAVAAVSHAIKLSRTGLRNSDQPIASLLFTGPSGTRKTLLSQALAQELFGSRNDMVRIDGSEYSESHSVSRLIGAPPGYVGYDQGGQLTEYVRRKPYCIVLLDEIEKTCPEFATLFLQVLSEGRLTDGKGRLVDFRNCVIIMTSNIGADLLANKQGTGKPSEELRIEVMKRFARQFPPEFLNRIDDIVMFRGIPEDVIQQILDKQLDQLKQREGLRNLYLQIQPDAKRWLAKEGVSAQYGARLLARVIQKQLLNHLSQALLSESVQDGDTVFVRVNGDGSGLAVDFAGPRR